MDGTLATIMMFAGNFAPQKWTICNGQLISIASNTALFSLLGTTYGGDGRSTFGLPDLRGRLAVGEGRGPGLSPYTLGQSTNQETVTLQTANLPAHSHSAGSVNIPASPAGASTEEANGNILATPGIEIYAAANTTPSVNYGSFSVAVANEGAGQPFPIMQPYLCTNFVICTAGTFPSRS